MDRDFDEMLKKSLAEQAEPLPKSYTERVEKVLSELPDKKTEYIKRLNLKYVAAAIIAFCMVVTGAHAGVNIYREYLHSMSNEDKEQLNEKTQNTTDDSDHFSRELSGSENNKMESLRNKYEKEGLFPEKRIIEVSQKNKVKKGQLTFCYENSTFYIPDNEMTDEEILEIIDFWERRDYAVKEKNSENNNSDKLKNVNQKIDDKAAVKIANEVLQKAYGMDTDSAEINIEFDCAELTENKSLPSYFVSLSKKSWKYDATVEVDSKNGTINQINVSHKTKNECVSGIKVNEDSYRENAAKIYHILEGIGKKNSDAQEIYLVYKYCKNGTLNRGNVKYLVKMKDGSGYVFLYSVNTGMIYNFYKVYDYKKILNEEKMNQKLTKDGGVLTRCRLLNK